MTAKTRPFEQAKFQNSFVDALPGDDAPNTRPRQVPGVCYSRTLPTPVRDPHLLAWSENFAAFLGLTRPPTRGAAVDLLAGNAVSPTMRPFAARYGGHQFGNWAGQLGDGRALSLGEITATDGTDWEIQLKGAGPTPYSRRADGRAVLRSSVREFLCSEAMHALGVPTTRALSLVGTGDTVVRDMFYNGDPRGEPGAIVARVAPTFVRFGSFEILTALGEYDNLRRLADYVIHRFFGELGEPSVEVYGTWFAEICRRTAVMIADWMAVGFVHGVMNTDNMSILGLTIDYGPYGWLEPYEPDWTPNTTDFSTHRYAFGQQPNIGLWNLMMLARALAPLVGKNDEALERGLELYRTTLGTTLYTKMQRKLGLTPLRETDDTALLEELHQSLAASQVDMTLFFRGVSHLAPRIAAESPDSAAARFRVLVAEIAYAPAQARVHDRLVTWFTTYHERLQQEPGPAEARRDGMLVVNPKYVLRNYLAQQAIEGAEQGDLSFLNTLRTVLQNPYDEQPAHEALAAKRPDWARDKPGCATLSCSS